MRTKEDQRAQFDGLAERYGCPQAKKLPIKKKKAVLRHLNKGQPSADRFAALAIKAMSGLAKATIREADKTRAMQMKAAVRRAARREYDDMLASLAMPVSRIAGQAEHLNTLAGLPADLFFKTPEWRRTRWEALNNYGRRCISCGAVPEDEARLTATHVISRIVRPELAFDLSNIRILCVDCHIGRRTLTGSQDA
jgi:hypothetical protein